MYCTKKKEKDQDYETKLITQYPNHLKTFIPQNLDNEDNDEDDESYSMDDSYYSDYDSEDGDGDDENKNQKLA